MQERAPWNPFKHSLGVLELIDEDCEPPINIGRFSIRDLTPRLRAEFDAIGEQISELEKADDDDPATERRMMELLCQQIELPLYGGKQSRVADQLMELYEHPDNERVGIGFLTGCQKYLLEAFGLAEGNA